MNHIETIYRPSGAGYKTGAALAEQNRRPSKRDWAVEVKDADGYHLLKTANGRTRKFVTEADAIAAAEQHYAELLKK